MNIKDFFLIIISRLVAGIGILPVLSQQLLSRMSEQQRTTSLALGWDEEEGITLEFGGQVML